MRTLAVLLACLACAGRGRRVQWASNSKAAFNPTAARQSTNNVNRILARPRFELAGKADVQHLDLSRKGAAPTMIVDQMKKAAEELKGAAAETIIAQKVADKLAKAKEKYPDIPDKYIKVMTSLFTSYMAEVYKAGNDMDKYEDVLSTIFKQVLAKANDPYDFPPYHKAIREPFDYYQLGNEFLTGVVDFDNSAIIGQNHITEIQKHVAAGDNVVLLANHQSEADPQIFSVLLDPIVPGFAESTIFVAGDRVTTDLLAQPFSMGRNLLCIFSKKHIDNPPELKSQKTRHNRNVMKEMQNLFKEGGKVIWVAPSGGRDRKGEDGNFKVAPFDPKSVEMFRLMADKAGKTTHFFPLSMHTHIIAPPPDAVGGAVGEERKVMYGPAGLHFGEEVDLEKFVSGCVVDNFPEGCDPTQERELLRNKLSEHVHSIVDKNYQDLESSLDEVFKKVAA